MAMTDNRHLLLGLNALSRAHTLEYFADGHRGGAIISGVYLSRAHGAEPGVADCIATIIDEQWADTALCAPFASEDPNPSLLTQLTTALGENLTGLREAGHNVILPTLALKALRELPDAITPSRIVGICQLIESFSAKDIPLADDFALPDMQNKTRAAEFLLAEFIDCTERFTGRGQGWSGHLLTYSKAIFDLRELGYQELAIQAEEGFKLYIRRIRKGPQDTDKNYSEHEPIEHFPLQTAYWQQRGGDLHLGHKLKYPYGFYGLMQLAQDTDLQRRCLDVAYRIF